ncbi:hypothetical protein DDE01_06710 [Desulfovibrio desulfuricans]|nr:hypothetical protein DDE01_06710 [Desulfovibrio desulfuricans]
MLLVARGKCTVRFANGLVLAFEHADSQRRRLQTIVRIERLCLPALRRVSLEADSIKHSRDPERALASFVSSGAKSQRRGYHGACPPRGYAGERGGEAVNRYGVR